MPRLSILLFGPLRVTLDGQPVTGFDSDKVRALLAYLAVETETPHSRERLAGLLWPDQTERSARANLRHVLANLRNVIGDRAQPSDGWAPPPFLHVSRQTIQFNRSSDAWVDVSAFTDLLRTSQPADHQSIHQLEKAVALYGGGFLEGFSLPGCSAFEEWMLFEGARMQRLSLGRLSDCYEKQDNVQRALEHTWRQVELEPWREEAHRQVMRLLALGGQRGAALAQYETCRRILVEELGVEPGAETTQLYEQIRDSELEILSTAPTLVREPEPIARLPGFLKEEAEEAQPPVFVAREREMARLEGALEATLAGQGRVVFVTGGPGRGKTALLGEFGRQAMEAHPDLLVASGNCNAYSGVGDPYLPFREVLGMLTGDVEARWLAGAVTTEHARRLWYSLRPVVQALMEHGPHITSVFVPGTALLSRAALWCAAEGEPQSAPWFQRLRERVERQQASSEELEQSHLFQQVTNVLRDLAEAHPLCLILDDLQWADTASIGLLFHLGRRLEGVRMLVAGAYRSEEVALGRGRERHPLEKVLSEFKRAYGDVWLDLAEVEERERRRFVDAFLETESNRLGESFRRALLDHTAGHPLFTIELLRTMQQRGDLILDDAGHWIEGPVLDWEMLPARVEGVIEERVARLEPELREILSVASVEGEEFTAQVVAQVQGIGQRHLLRALSQDLQRRHRLVREQGAVPVGQKRLSRHRFAHALFQQYLYSHLGEGERTLLHGQIAAVLEGLYEGSTEMITVQLAHHYSEAGDDPRALQYLALAGDVALASYANEEAEQHYRKGLQLAPGVSQRAHLLSGLGQALSRQSRFREAIQTNREGIRLHQALADPESVAQLYERSASDASAAGDGAEGLRLCQEGLAALSGAPESVGLAQLLCRAGARYVFSAMPDEGLPLCQQALETAERLGAVEVQADALAWLGRYGGLSPEKSLELLATAVELAEGAGLLEVAASAHNRLAVHQAYTLADARTARDHCCQAADLYRQVGRTVDQAYVLVNVATNSQFLGEFEEAEATLSLVRQLLSQVSEPGQAAYNAHFCEIWLLGHLGEWAEAARLARALQADTRGRNATFLGVAGYLLAWVVLESYVLGGGAPAGDWLEAGAAAAEAIEILDHLPFYVYRVETRTVLGAVHIRQGRLEEARRALEEAQEKAKAQPSGWDEQSLLWLEARLATAERRWPEARAAFETLAGIHERLGWRWRRARALLDWAKAHMARGQAADIERARDLLRDAQTAFEEMGIPRYAAVAQDQLQALRSTQEPAA
jgi:DNA-binding SARP family transcriptional activator/predicted ATPase